MALPADRMKRLLPALILTLAACTNVQDIPTDVVPITTPMLGSVQDGVYHAAAERFDVALPRRFDDAEYQLMLKEEFKPNLSLVSFIPARNIAEHYYVYLEDFAGEKRTLPGLEKLADGAFNFFGKSIADSRLEPLVFVKQQPWKTRYTTGLMRLYTERVPSGFGAINLKMSEDYEAYHLLYVTEEAGKAAILWLEWPKSCSFCRPLPTDPAQLASADPVAAAMAGNLRAAGFIDSIEFDPTRLTQAR